MRHPLSFAVSRLLLIIVSIACLTTGCNRAAGTNDAPNDSSTNSTSSSSTTGGSSTNGSSQPPTIISLSEAQGRPGDEIQISGNNLGVLTQTVVFSGPSGIPIAITAEPNSSPSTVYVPVPLQTATGSVFVQVPDGKGNFVNSNPLLFTRLPDLRIRTSVKDLGAGESTTLQLAIFGSTTPQSVVWSSDVGRINNTGAYIAPASVQSDTFAHISACIEGTHTCDTLLVGLHPFRLAPIAPVVPLGAALQLQALVAGAPVTSAWSQISGGGTLLTDGAYTASATASDGGGELVWQRMNQAQSRRPSVSQEVFQGLSTEFTIILTSILPPSKESRSF